MFSFLGNIIANGKNLHLGALSCYDELMKNIAKIIAEQVGGTLLILATMFITFGFTQFIAFITGAN